jgi:hypothetical protein
MTPDELREQARSIYTNGKALDNQVTDLIFAMVMGLAEVTERLDKLIEQEDSKDVIT